MEHLAKDVKSQLKASHKYLKMGNLFERHSTQRMFKIILNDVLTSIINVVAASFRKNLAVLMFMFMTFSIHLVHSCV